MSSDSAISVRDLAKCYQLYGKPENRLKQFLWRGRRQFFSEIWALHPISFDIGRGECVGFIGRNGSGKSTLLQLVAGILNPTSGTLGRSGRLSALLELGAGFNAEFTGRENVYLNGAILGLSIDEISRRMPDIEAFAEIGEFIDRPVKTYSSGMFIRLAFSAAIHVDPEILIIDEALSVGDAPFQFKCLQKIEELRKRNVSILFVTHDTPVVKRFCNRAGWLHEGRLVAMGDAVEVTHQYEDFSRVNMTQPVSAETAPQTGNTNGSASTAHHAKLLSGQLVDTSNRLTSAFVSGGALTLRVSYQVLVEPAQGLVIGAALFRNDALYVCGLNTLLDKTAVKSSVGEHHVDLVFPNLSLIPSSYYLNIAIFDHTATVQWDFLGQTCPFTVVGPYVGEGVVILDHQWKSY